MRMDAMATNVLGMRMTPLEPARYSQPSVVVNAVPLIDFNISFGGSPWNGPFGADSWVFTAFKPAVRMVYIL